MDPRRYISYMSRKSYASLRSLHWLFLFSLFALIGCNSIPSSPEATTTEKPASCSLASPFTPGKSLDQTLPIRPELALGLKERQYRVHIPASYQQGQFYPLVLAFHGYGWTAAEMEERSGFSRLADQQGFIVVYPQGLREPKSGLSFWAGVDNMTVGLDDVTFIGNLITSLENTLCIDKKRTYATGFSNGGGMIGLLACRMADRIAAIAPVSGNFYALPGGCQPGRAVPILEIHGTSDIIIPYNGMVIQIDDRGPMLSVESWLHEWAERNQCADGPTPFLTQPDLEGIQWTKCQSDVVVMHYRFINGGHNWPGAINGTPGTTVIWQFFQKYPLQ